jgi:hypothetical protein
MRSRAEANLIRRMITAEEIAYLLAFLASPKHRGRRWLTRHHPLLKSEADPVWASGLREPSPDRSESRRKSSAGASAIGGFLVPASRTRRHTASVSIDVLELGMVI